MSTTSYERLIEDLRAEFRPQRSWGAGRGVFMIIGHFVVGVAAGAWLLSLLYASPAGLAARLRAGVPAGARAPDQPGPPGAVLADDDAGRATSWVSRGFWGLCAFLVGGVPLPGAAVGAGAPWSAGSLHRAARLRARVPGDGDADRLHGVRVRGLQGDPVLELAAASGAVRRLCAARRGGGAAAGAGVRGEEPGELPRAAAVVDRRLTALVAAFFALELHGAWTGGQRGGEALGARDLFAGDLALAFYGGTLVLGLAVPAGLVWWRLYGRPRSAGDGDPGARLRAGDFFMKYATIRAGVHLPVWTRRLPRG